MGISSEEKDNSGWVMSSQGIPSLSAFFFSHCLRQKILHEQRKAENYTYAVKFTPLSRYVMMAEQQLSPLATGKPAVLVIEDNADQWVVIRRALHQCFSEVEPFWIADPMQAIIYLETCLEQVHEFPPFILLDLGLPSCQTGLKTLRLLKQRDKLYCEIPVVVLSQFSNPRTVKEAYD